MPGLKGFFQQFRNKEETSHGFKKLQNGNGASETIVSWETASLSSRASKGTVGSANSVYSPSCRGFDDHSQFDEVNETHGASTQSKPQESATGTNSWERACDDSTRISISSQRSGFQNSETVPVPEKANTNEVGLETDKETNESDTFEALLRLGLDSKKSEDAESDMFEDLENDKAEAQGDAEPDSLQKLIRQVLEGSSTEFPGLDDEMESFDALVQQGLESQPGATEDVAEKLIGDSKKMHGIERVVKMIEKGEDASELKLLASRDSTDTTSSSRDDDTREIDCILDECEGQSDNEDTGEESVTEKSTGTQSIIEPISELPTISETTARTFSLPIGLSTVPSGISAVDSWDQENFQNVHPIARMRCKDLMNDDDTVTVYF